MSRNHKDKYENSNPRRMYTLMCPEDYQSGKKSHWSELEITGSIRNLSPNLWQMTHLTALYLNDNSLQRVPSEIGRLVNLRILDLSSNKLRSLPAELGELIYLRELLLNQNYLRVLPYELGKLFQLQVLGLQGNPLSKDVMTLYGNGEPAGTNKLLTYMLDNLQATRALNMLRQKCEMADLWWPHFSCRLRIHAGRKNRKDNPPSRNEFHAGDVIPRKRYQVPVGAHV
ncbi:CCR4-NOT transcription complex subunit 6-like isoform X1 [Temnothorax longispinosus]|uniref:CCR4-NOT transcription complex subunit 6-like isoform X1 n=1 Tax=Temnothorax longispinosus TaxID=300112 RepID=UPI003A998825